MGRRGYRRRSRSLGGPSNLAALMAPNPESQDETEERVGLFDSIRRLATNIVGLVEARLELISTDIAEARSRVIQLAIVVGVVLVCIQVGVLLLLIALILSIPETSRPEVVGTVGGVLLVGAIAGILYVRYRLTRRRPFFEATLAEFQKDREKLGRKK